MAKPIKLAGNTGPATGESGNIDHTQIPTVLSGEAWTAESSGEEANVWLDSFAEKMGQPGSDEKMWFARRRQLGLGVGLDSDGSLVREKTESNT